MMAAHAEEDLLHSDAVEVEVEEEEEEAAV
jgi:hypothetical protein